MSQLELKICPDPCLRIKTKPVERFDEELKSTLCHMSDIMYIHQGIGLAATQVGLGMDVIVIDVGEGIKNLVNPEIVEVSKKRTKMEEGCLSVPDVRVNVTRPEQVKVRSKDENGEAHLEKFDGLLAKAVQHEIDHLHGRLIIDYLDPIRRFLAKRRLTGHKNSPYTDLAEEVA